MGTVHYPGIELWSVTSLWWLLQKRLRQGGAAILLIGSTVAYAAAFWAALYACAFVAGKGAPIPLSLAEGGIIGGAVGTILLGATLALTLRKFLRGAWHAFLVIGTGVGAALAFGCLGEEKEIPTLGNFGTRFFIFLWQFAVAAYLYSSIYSCKAPGWLGSERGLAIRRWTTRLVWAALVISLIHVVVVWVYPGKEKPASGGSTQPDSANATALSVAPEMQPQAASAEATAWANDYRNAKFITRAEFLKKVGPVHLLVRERSGVSDHLHNADGIVRESAAQHGYTIVPEATAIQLVVDVDVSHAKLVETTYTNFSRSERSDTVIWTISVQIDLATKAICRRGDKFVQLNVSPYRAFDLLYGEMGNLVDFDAAYASHFRTLIDRCFDSMAKLTDADDTDNEAAWTNSLWPSAQNGEMQKKFLSAMKVEPGAPNPVFYGVTKFKPLDIDVVEDGRKEFNEGSLQQSWTSELSRNGQEIDPSSEFRIRHNVGTWHLEGLFFSEPVFYVDWSSIRVYQNNVVFQFNGELRRAEVCIWRALDSATALPKDNSNTARDVVNRSIRSAAKEFGSNR